MSIGRGAGVSRVESDARELGSCHSAAAITIDRLEPHLYLTQLAGLHLLVEASIPAVRFESTVNMRRKEIITNIIKSPRREGYVLLKLVGGGGGAPENVR